MLHVIPLLFGLVAQPPPPNFVIFFTDDQGYNDVGCYGSPLIKTPRMDRMAREGLRFTSFYAQNVCGPSRAALLTGSYPIRCAEPNNRKNPHTILHPRETTIAEVLKTRGYATACIGKWHLAGGGLAKGSPGGRGPYRSELMPNAQGFDYFFGTPAHNGTTREPRPASWVTELHRNGERLEKNVDLHTVTQRYTDESIRFIRENQRGPFFLYLAHTMPHVPLGVDPKFLGRSERGLYGDVITELDASLGRILDTLAELKIDRQTLVLFTSDNGPWVESHLAGKGGKDAHYGSAAPLRGYKMTTWEGGLRVPGILRWPGHVPAGKVSDEIVTTLDILPTFARLAGAKLPADREIDGMDMSDLLLGRTERSGRKEFLFYSYTHLHGVREGQWKLVLPRPAKPAWLSWYARMTEAVPAPQLYNLAEDVGEKLDLAAKQPEIVKRLLQRVEAARAELGDYNRTGGKARFFDDAPKRPQAIRYASSDEIYSHPDPVGELRFDFESGDLQGWKTVEGSFEALLNDRTHFHHALGAAKYNKQGKYFLTTLERAEGGKGRDAQTGVVDSPIFVLEGPRMSFLVGGGGHANTYVALCDAGNEKELLRARGKNTEILQRVNWNASQMVGRTLFLRIVDRNVGPWGHVTFDDFSAQAKLNPQLKRKARMRVRSIQFRTSAVSGIGKQNGICRRDPSDIIKVTDTFYLWYSRTTRHRKLYPSGYNATVWYATSTDEGRNWIERGEAVGLGEDGAFDSFGVFTPNILVHEGKYYLFYTAVAQGFTNRGYRDIGRTAIGLAVADSPAGPWTKVAHNPVLVSTRNAQKFDSFRVDDTCFVKREGKIWMYYKGRQWEKTPGETQMGVAVADRPEGPYRRLCGGRPVQQSGHEVLVWPHGEGVLSLVSKTGPQGQTLQYAADGLDFCVVGTLPHDYPRAPGAFRPDMADPALAGEDISWGVAMATYRGDPYLLRYEISVKGEECPRD